MKLCTIVRIICCLLFALDCITSQSTECSTEDTGCDCEQTQDGGYKMSCDRESLDRVPKLTASVTELHMFRTTLMDKTLTSNSLRLAKYLQTVRIESCDITGIENGAFSGLYSMTTLVLANNDIQSLTNGVFSELNPLQSLDLSTNSLRVLHSEMFSGLVNLNTLDISYNSITVLPRNLLKHLTSLKILRMENTLVGIQTIPDIFLSYTPQLEILTLNSNKITQIQMTLFDNTPAIREISLKDNEVSTLSAEVFKREKTPQLSVLQLEDNPFMCDCNLIGYRIWIDSMSSKSWPPARTGKCSLPRDLQGESISTLPLSRFSCPSTTPVSSLLATSTAVNDLFTTPHARVVSPLVTDASQTTDGLTQQPEVLQINEEDDKKSLERSLIIGCSVGGAFLLIIVNILIICCVKRAKQQTGSRRIKYILRPDSQEHNIEDLYSNPFKPFKQPTVDTGNGHSYMISNGSSGFYHTGSRSRLYGTDLEDTIYSTPPKVPPKSELYSELPTPKLQSKSYTELSRHDNITLNNSSIYNIPVDDSYPTEYSTDQGSFYVPQYSDIYHIPSDIVSDHPARRHLTYPDLSTMHTDKHLHKGDSTYNDENAYEFDTLALPPLPHHDKAELIPESIIDPDRYSKYYGYDNYLDINAQELDPAESQEFEVGASDIKHSTGSGADSGVHSYTPPCHSDTIRTVNSEKQALADRHHSSINRSVSINRNISINSHNAASPSQRRIRNETYV